MPNSEDLSRIVGRPNAKLVLYFGRMFPLARCHAMPCYAMRLIDEVAEDHALSGAKRLAGESTARAAEITAAQKAAADSGDYREATASFLEKRPPTFRGRRAAISRPSHSAKRAL